MRSFIAAFCAVTIICITVLVASAPSGGGDSLVRDPIPDQPSYSLEGMNGPLLEQRWYEAVVFRKAEQEALWREAAAQAEAQAAASRSRSQPRSYSGGGTVTGSCADMKPPGFPDWIIQRESRGDPNARNPSGAYGCAQLMPSTGGSGTYAERWARTWAGGAGACNWEPPRYCAG